MVTTQDLTMIGQDIIMTVYNITSFDQGIMVTAKDITMLGLHIIITAHGIPSFDQD